MVLGVLPMFSMQHTASAVAIRLAKDTDAVAIAAIHHELWHKTYTFLSEKYRAAITYDTWDVFWKNFFKKQDGSWALVAECDKQVVGFIAIIPTDKGDAAMGGFDAEINKFYVKPEYQKRGVGFQLIAACRERLCSLDKHKIVFQSFEQNDKANALYDKLGAVIIGRQTADMGGIVHGRFYKIPECVCSKII